MTDSAVREHDIANKNRLPFMLVLFIPCLFVLFTSLDNDIWFLLNHGRYVLANGIPHIEPFTIHQGFRFVMQQWLSAVVFWLVYNSIGIYGVKLLVMLFYGILVFILFKLCMKVSDNYFFISFVITLACAIVLSYFMVSRPYIFSAPVFALELYLLESYRKNLNYRFLLLLPFLSVLLVNFHAAMWPMFFVILVPYVVETLKFEIGPFAGHGVEKKWLYTLIPVSFAAGFINPYGLEAMLYLFRSYGYDQINSKVNEMTPATVTSGMGIIVFACILIVTIIYLTYKKGIRRLRYILLAFGTAYMALSSCKSLLFFVLCAFFPLAAYLKDFNPVFKQPRDSRKTRIIRNTTVLCFIILIPLGFFAVYNASKTNDYEYRLLDETIDVVLNENKVDEVVLYTGYDTGGLAEFRGIKAYMDPRAEVFVIKNNGKEDIYSEYTGLQSGSIYYKDVLDKYQFTHLIVTKDDLLCTYLQHDKDYTIQYSNKTYFLFKNLH